MNSRTRIRMFDRPARLRTADQAAALLFPIEKLAPIAKLGPGSADARDPVSPAAIARDIEPLVVRLVGEHSKRIPRTGADDVAMRDRLATAWQVVAAALDELETTVIAAEELERTAAAAKATAIERKAAGSSKTTDRGEPTSMREVIGDINKANSAYWDAQK
jgi:hypothetical protein